VVKDSQFGTGEYDPEKYWSVRLEHSKDSMLRAIGVFAATEIENKSMDRVQRSAFRRAIKKIDLNKKSVLEFGCGIGRWITLFPWNSSKWHGVDISDKMLSVAKSIHPEIDFKKVIDNKIPYPDDVMDFAYSITVIHHNSYRDQENILSEMVRVLKNGGYLLLIEDLGEAGSHNSFNYFPRKRESWISITEKCGMKLYWQSGVQYWILKALLYRILHRLSGLKTGFRRKTAASGKPFVPKVLISLLDWIDLIVDQYLCLILPKREHRVAVLLFRKM
jgi:ubiquinone/menaquinone biosynthesis C-methylase UbiE